MTNHVIVNLEIHLASLEYIPGHAEIDAWVWQYALLIAFRGWDQLVKPF